MRLIYGISNTPTQGAGGQGCRTGPRLDQSLLPATAICCQRILPNLPPLCLPSYHLAQHGSKLFFGHIHHLSLDLVFNNHESEIPSDLSQINLIVLKILSSQISSLPDLGLAAGSRTSNSKTSPASPATEVFNPCWQPTAGRLTLQFHQPFKEDTSKATSSASGPVSLQSDILTSFTGGLQQEGDSCRIGTVRDAGTTIFLILSFCSILNFIRQMLEI